jgi:hypothetical protein
LSTFQCVTSFNFDCTQEAPDSVKFPLWVEQKQRAMGGKFTANIFQPFQDGSTTNSKDVKFGALHLPMGADADDGSGKRHPGT